MVKDLGQLLCETVGSMHASRNAVALPPFWSLQRSWNLLEKVNDVQL